MGKTFTGELSDVDSPVAQIGCTSLPTYLKTNSFTKSKLKRNERVF